ncbi:S24 family peptidase [Arcobacter arenosus]|uniref:Helix-turn-helix transcriptional regulator n=1 Tax=Arcobacter arenosus TaxID=2576037 RepID=A0A5R8XYK9_9BACT|nr:S24 family peptidase [Arcobacter arenosus]TLP36225.1 helix-turn-helix transcriptional regulator [Arcobacter arenosus]
MISSNFESVMQKIRVYLQEKNDCRVFDKDIAKALEISTEHYSRSKTENKIPLQPIINFCAKENIVINYILFDQMPESLHKTTDKIISVKYFKNVNSSAGGGAFNDEENCEYLDLDLNTIKRLGGIEKAKHIEALNVTGESMEPVIKDNSIVFIDKTSITPKLNEDDVYVVNTPNGILVKQVILIEELKKIQLLSYNKLYLPEIFYCDEVTIIGKVIAVRAN